MTNDAGLVYATQPNLPADTQLNTAYGGVRPPKATMMIVTPEMATAWISPAMNPSNRRMKKVDYFVNVIETGQFSFTGEPVQFSGFLDEGTANLRNGQNRLNAIARTGIAQLMLVVEGIDPKVMPYLDTGARRSFADNLHAVRKQPNANALASVTRLHYILSNPSTRRALISGGGTLLFTYADLDAWFEQHELPIKMSLYHARRVREVFGTSTSAGGAAWVLLHEGTLAAPEDVDEFFNRLVTEGPTGLRERRGRTDPMEALRRWLTNQVKQAKPKPRATQQTAIIIKGWNFDQQGMPVENLVWRPAGGEDFPDVL